MCFTYQKFSCNNYTQGNLHLIFHENCFEIKLILHLKSTLFPNLGDICDNFVQLIQCNLQEAQIKLDAIHALPC